MEVPINVGNLRGVEVTVAPGAKKAAGLLWRFLKWVAQGLLIAACFFSLLGAFRDFMEHKFDPGVLDCVWLFLSFGVIEWHVQKWLRAALAPATSKIEAPEQPVV